ncbi:MAG TPA: hypothetical protein VK797_23015 [Tepidisphaeraceae bacterium]|jgi:hypothetical protein|nr:hypothetical protein [Tepidisphaeraceae bacterium]
MSTVATPVETWTATIQAGIGIGQSSSFTFTVNITQAWQIKIPIIVQFPTNVSAGPQVFAYRSTDGGNTFDTQPLQPLGLPRQSGGLQQVSLRLETGQYAVQVLSGGGSVATWTVQVQTQEVTTAIINQ